jgi:hypothetical protein
LYTHISQILATNGIKEIYRKHCGKMLCHRSYFQFVRLQLISKCSKWNGISIYVIKVEDEVNKFDMCCVTCDRLYEQPHNRLNLTVEYYQSNLCLMARWVRLKLDSFVKADMLQNVHTLPSSSFIILVVANITRSCFYLDIFLHIFILFLINPDISYP